MWMLCDRSCRHIPGTFFTFVSHNGTQNKLWAMISYTCVNWAGLWEQGCICLAVYWCYHGPGLPTAGPCYWLSLEEHLIRSSDKLRGKMMKPTTMVPTLSYPSASLSFCWFVFQIDLYFFCCCCWIQDVIIYYFENKTNPIPASRNHTFLQCDLHWDLLNHIHYWVVIYEAACDWGWMENRNGRAFPSICGLSLAQNRTPHHRPCVMKQGGGWTCSVCDASVERTQRSELYCKNQLGAPYLMKRTKCTLGSTVWIYMNVQPVITYY